MHEASIVLAATPQRPQVRVALSRWTSADGANWVTTGPPIAAGRSYAFDGQLGYLMTAPPNQSAGVKLDECFSARSGNGFLTEAGRCEAEGTERRRVAGFAFRSEQPGTIAIYSCLSRDYARFTSSSGRLRSRKAHATACWDLCSAEAAALRLTDQSWLSSSLPM